MFFRSSHFFIALVFFASVSFSAYSQDFVLPSQEPKETYMIFDRLMGKENLAVSNGWEYIERHRMINDKHKFYQSFDFKKGIVYYDGQPYFNIDIKYNIVDDLVLVQFNYNGAKNVYSLYPSKLNGFSLNDRSFINIQFPHTSYKGIFEIIFESADIKVLKKHQMKEKKILEGELLYYEFEKEIPEYFFTYKGKVIRLNSKNLITVFPKQKEVIRKFFRKSGKDLAETSELPLTNLFEELAENDLSE